MEEQNALLQKAVVLRVRAEAQLQQSLDRAVLVVTTVGEIQFCTRLARRFLKRYFPEHGNPDVPPAVLTE